jgi:hypothetical protein
LCEICHDRRGDASSLPHYRLMQMVLVQAHCSVTDECHQFEVCDSDQPALDAQLADFGPAEHQTMLFRRCLPDQASCDSCHRENLGDASSGRFDPLGEIADHRLVTMLQLCRR